MPVQASVAVPQAGTDVPITQALWAAFLITQISAQGKGNVPLTASNIQKIELWMISEEPANNWYHNWNPLNINASGSGSDVFPNLTAAANTTAGTIVNYPAIMAALEQDINPADFGRVVANATNATNGGYWAKGRYEAECNTGPGCSFASTVGPQVSAGSGAKVLPADPGAAIPANPFPGPVGAIAGLATGGTSVPSTSSGWLGSLATILGDFTSASWWKRVGVFTLGGVLVIGGVILFVSTTKTGQKVESDAAVAAAA